MKVINDITTHIAMVWSTSHILMYSTYCIKVSIQIIKYNNKSLLMQPELVITYCISTVT